MKAIRFMDPGVIEYSEIPQPEIRDDEVLAQIAYAGFCATDIELLTGEMIHIKNGNTKYPIIPGHEWSGTVVAVGKNVRDFKSGRPGHLRCELGMRRVRKLPAGPL